jgi:hypothetical protein
VIGTKSRLQVTGDRGQGARMSKIESHRDLSVWQKAMDLTVQIYRLASLFPQNEIYRLTSQITRAAASVPANIAEGHARGTRKDYAHFYPLLKVP